MEMGYFQKYRLHKVILCYYILIHQNFHLFDCPFFVNGICDIGYTGNSSSTGNRKDGERPFNVLFCHLCNILLCSSFRILGIWEQIQFKHSQELDPGRGSSLGSYMGVRSCSRARPLPTLRHWSGKLK